MKGKQVKPTVTYEWIKLEPVLGEKCLAKTPDELTSFESLQAIFEFRANLLLQKTGFELSNRLLGENKIDSIDAWNQVQPFYIQELSKAYANLFIITESINRISALVKGTDKSVEVNEDTKESLLLILKLDALTQIHKDIGTWLEAEYFDAHQVQMIRDTINKTMEQFKRHAVAFTYALMPVEDQLDSMLAPQDGELYKSIVSRMYNAPRAFERIENWKELYK
jgi:hypothetical protein